MNRPQLINALIDRYGYRRYLEIGCATDKTFNAVTAEKKVGVDPVCGGTHRMTSDDFFLNQDELYTFDIIFIDGDHCAGQVYRDVNNSLTELAVGGCIVFDDCLPIHEIHQDEPRASQTWMGGVWKVIAELRSRTIFNIRTLDNNESGLAVMFSDDHDGYLENTWRIREDLRKLYIDYTWADYVVYKEELLGILPEHQFKIFCGIN